MPKNGRLTTILSGIAGQFFAAAEVSRRGYIATLTLRNTRGVDMLVSCADASKSLGIQVKTNQSSKKTWLLDKKAEESASDSLVYIFVNLNGLCGTPTFHVVPSQVVADFVRESHQKYISGASKRGGTRRDTSMRKFKDEKGEYLDKWHQLTASLEAGRNSK